MTTTTPTTTNSFNSFDTNPDGLVTVYEKPACIQCRMTKKWLEARGISFRTGDATAPEVIAAAKELAIAAAPIVAFPDGTVVGGFRPDVLSQQFPEDQYPVLKAAA